MLVPINAIAKTQRKADTETVTKRDSKLSVN